MYKFLLLFILILPSFAFSQEYDCESNLGWVIETFKENDAGFEYVISTKGIDSYRKHTQELLDKSRSITINSSCYELMYDWMRFFRKGHFEIRPLDQESPSIDTNNWKTLDINIDKFKEHLKYKKRIDFEGIWKSGPYEIGIKKIEGSYVGFIISAEGNEWKKGQIKLVINSDQSSLYYMGDYSAQSFDKAELFGISYLQLGFVTFKRVFPESQSSPIIERYYRAISAEKPFFDEVNDNTVYLRIPSFDNSHREDINKLISFHFQKITSTKNLIIDLRGNGGGSDRSFEGILPLIYTNPIKTVGVELLSTPLNNQRVKNFITHPHASNEIKEWAENALKKLSDNEGRFVNLEESDVTTTKFDMIYEYPKNVGIIIDGENASSTEQFLLAARQSKKVKLFGQTTFGALDISYTYPVTSPSGDFELVYCLSKSLRIPEMTIDDTGIHPDYFIYNNIPKYEWISFVTKALD